MKILIFSAFLLFLSSFSMAAEPKIPADYAKQIESSSLNYLEKKVAYAVLNAVKNQKVVLDTVADYLFVQVVPSYIYKGPGGEERLGQDLMGLLGTIQTKENAAIMALEFKELEKMRLPFPKKITESLLIDSKSLKDIEITFFVELNSLTGRIYEALQRIEESKLIYNSTSRFYRIESTKSKCYFMLHIPNIAYEIAYTGNTIENVLKRETTDVRKVFSVMKKYEEKILKNPKTTFDGRYIRGSNFSVDLWFLMKYIETHKITAEAVMEDILKEKSLKIEGREKESVN